MIFALMSFPILFIFDFIKLSNMGIILLISIKKLSILSASFIDSIDELRLLMFLGFDPKVLINDEFICVFLFVSNLQISLLWAHRLYYGNIV